MIYGGGAIPTVADNNTTTYEVCIKAFVANTFHTPRPE